MPTPSSVERVRAALRAAGHADAVTTFEGGVHTAAAAAAAIGCTVAQIAKSIVFRAGDRAVVVIASGANRVDPAKVQAVLGVAVAMADAAFVRDMTGFVIGGVSPVGHLTPPLLVFDRDLLDLHPVWAAAGSPETVFASEAADLARITGAVIADIRAEG